MKKDAFKKDLTAMFNNMAKKKAKALAAAKGKPAEDLKPEFHHKYFATYRRAGHKTVRFYPLGQGERAIKITELFVETALPKCEYLVVYQVHALTGEITEVDPAKNVSPGFELYELSIKKNKCVLSPRKLKKP